MGPGLEDQEGGCAHRDVILHNREEREDRMTGRLSTNQWQEVGDNDKENVREDLGSVAKGVLSPDSPQQVAISQGGAPT